MLHQLYNSVKFLKYFVYFVSLLKKVKSSKILHLQNFCFSTEALFIIICVWIQLPKEKESKHFCLVDKALNFKNDKSTTP